MLRHIVIALFVVNLGFAATLETLTVKISNVCEDSVNKNIVTVTDDGEPVVGAYVNVEDIDPWKKKTSGTVNSTGQFEFTGCEDTYNITASYGGYESKTITVDLPACQCIESEPEEEPGGEPVEEEEDAPEDQPPAGSQPADSEPPPASQPAETPPSEDAEESVGEPQEKKPLPCCPAGFVLLPLLITTVIMKAKQ